MIKESLSEAGLTPIAVVSLVLFVVIFLGIVAWTLTRSRKAVSDWSALPLADGAEPVNSRGSDSEPRTVDNHAV